MIAVKRGKCPKALGGSPMAGDHYSRPEVERALWKMQHRKCCYCERDIPEIGQGKHVEHFRPKSLAKFKNKRNHWPNLLLACPQCNGQKGNQFPVSSNGGPVLIDPSSNGMDPERHIGFTADAEDEYDTPGLPKPLSTRGRRTIEVLDLWSPYHVRARAKYYRRVVFPLYRKMKMAEAKGDEKALKNAVSDFETLMSSKCEFAGFVRSFARNMDLDKSFDITIPARSD